MDFCLVGTGPCIHPLPCPVHGTRREDVAVVLTEYQWLVEPVEGWGRMITLYRGAEALETRLISVARMEREGEVRAAMLAAADLLPRRFAGQPLAPMLSR